MDLLDKILDKVEKKFPTATKIVKRKAKAVYNSVVTQDATVVPNKPKAQQTRQVQPQKVNKPSQPNSIMEKKDSSPVQSAGNVVPSIKVQNTQKTQKTQKTKTAKVSNKTTFNSVTITKEQIRAKNRAILSKADSLGISNKELDNMLIQRGLTVEKVNNMSIEEQYSTLCDIEQGLDIQIELKKKGIVAADVNIAKMVDENSKVTTEARKSGVLDNSKDAKKYQYAERMRKLLGDDFKELSLEEKRKRIDFVSNTIRQEYNADYEKKYNAASAAKKSRMQRLKPKLDAYVEKQIQLAFLNVSELCAEESVRFRNGHDIADAKRVACDVKENSSEVAGRMTHSWDMEYLAIFNERGEMPTAEEHKESVQVSTSRMKQQDIIQYETDANAAKEAFYKGESKYPFLTEEYYTATTVGIGMGATLNENMSEEQKVEFLNTWNTHAQKYKDYNSVKEQYDAGIKEYMEQHPEAKQGIENLKTKYQEKYGKTPDEPKVTQKMPEQKSANYIEERRSLTQQKTAVPNTSLQTSNTVTVKPKADEGTLKNVLKSKTIAEVKRDYSNSTSEIAEVVLKNDVEYRNRIDEVLDYLKGLSGTDIGFKVVGCTTHTISKIIQKFPAKANDILDIVAPTMCYAGKELVEKIVEEGKQQNEAA